MYWASMEEAVDMKIVEVSTYLDAPPDVIREHAIRPQLLEFVSKGMIRFKPIDPPAFPETWEDGAYRVGMYWKGFVPIGWQSIGIEHQSKGADTDENGVWRLRDNGHSATIRSWDHMLSIAPEGRGTRYGDRLDLDAGLLTPLVALFAKRFYEHRQKRWRLLVENDFDYSV